MRIATYKVHIDECSNQNYLIKDKSFNYTKHDYLSSSEAIADVMTNVFHINKCGEEYCFMIGVDTGLRPTGFFEISHGAPDYTIIRPREIMIRALLSGASGIILCHNHPSAKAIPSDEDLNLTSRIKEVCDLMCITLLDHIIIARDSYLSFKDSHLFDDETKGKRKFKN